MRTEEKHTLTPVTAQRKKRFAKINHYNVVLLIRKVYSVAERVKADVGNVAILVNNAGIVTGKKIVASSCEEMERVFQVNTLAHFWVCINSSSFE